MKPLERSSVKGAVIAGSAIAVAFLHGVVPAGPHAWHALHLIAQELYYIPLLLAAAWFSWRGTILTAAGVSVLYFSHVFLDWRGQPMIQAEQSASAFTFWLVALLASFLFARIREALDEVRLAHAETLTALASSLELRERYTAGHSHRVRSYTLLLAEKLGLTDSPTLAQLAAGALFHDIGKIGIPDAILLKQGPLDSEEWRVMRSHPELGAALVGSVRSLADTLELVRSHHERFDGTGYPRGLRGEDIPFGARLFAVADAFDAMTTTRSYRPAMTFDRAVRALRQGAGQQFDPNVVEAFLEVPFDVWSAKAAQQGVQLHGEPGLQAGQEDEVRLE